MRMGFFRVRSSRSMSRVPDMLVSMSRKSIGVIVAWMCEGRRTWVSDADAEKMRTVYGYGLGLG
jgi:hypothetical protein